VSEPLYLLPVAPRPKVGERLFSWLSRLAALYGTPVSALLNYFGLAGSDPFSLEKGLQAGQGALLAERVGTSIATIEAMTFREIAAPAQWMIARSSRAVCARCAENPTVQRKDAALPWSFWCSAHGLRRRPAGGQAIETLFGAAALAQLDPLARCGARRLADWAEGRDHGVPSVADLIGFLTLQHRRPSPPALHEQPPLSLAARRANHAFLQRPIARQALLVVAPEYDRVAPLLAKPVRTGLKALASGSLLQNFALAVGLARLMDRPVETAAAVLAASDCEGQDRVHEVLQGRPAAAHLRAAPRPHREQKRCPVGAAAGITAPWATGSLTNSGLFCLTNSAPESHKLRARCAAKGLSRNNPDHPTSGVFGAMIPSV
jgi:TniQ